MRKKLTREKMKKDQITMRRNLGNVRTYVRMVGARVRKVGIQLVAHIDLVMPYQ